VAKIRNEGQTARSLSRIYRTRFPRLRVCCLRPLGADRRPELRFLNGVALGIIKPMHVSRKFEYLLDAHRRPDGSQWTGQQLDEATGGVVTRSYFTNLRKGRIENPGYEKMRAIAKAMGFAPEEWFEEGLSRGLERPQDESRGIAGRVEHLFDAVSNPKTAEPYTNAEVARMSLGDLTEEDVEGIRTGVIDDPTVGQVAALAAAFGVEPSYLLDRDEPPLERELVEALRDEAVRKAALEISRLPEPERRLVLGIVRQFDAAERAGPPPNSGESVDRKAAR
jgi:transcriptional regulator with XRE-family HTH domain